MKTSGTSEFLLVIDEIQKIENWNEVVKQQWDKDTRENINIKVILLGSSRLLIQKELTESLAGRFETLYIGHWSYPEMLLAIVSVAQFLSNVPNKVSFCHRFTQNQDIMSQIR